MQSVNQWQHEARKHGCNMYTSAIILNRFCITVAHKIHALAEGFKIYQNHVARF